MTVERHFLGWDAPVVEKVRDYLVLSAPEGPVDLRGTLVLVPTRQAGRRLREALTRFCAERGTYLLAPTLRTPLYLVRTDDDILAASPVDVSAVWTDLLRTIDLSHFRGLFPTGVPVRDFGWALGTGTMLQSLREHLAEHGMSIQSVLADHGQALQERERWNDLAQLESLFLSQIETRFGLHDPSRTMLHRAQEPVLTESVKHIVLACNPDPTPTSLHALGILSANIPVDILIHAPESLADSFDDWGRPIAARWREAVVDVTEVDVKLASSPSAQGRLALAAIVEACCGPSDIALGVPETSVVPYLETALAEYGVATYDPAGAPVRHHPLFRLLEGYRDMTAQRSYAALSSLLRNADVLEHLRRTNGIGTRTLLTELDKFQNDHMPGSMQDVAERLHETRQATGASCYPALTVALKALQSFVESAANADPEQSLRVYLQTIFSERELQPGTPEDQEFRAVAERVDEALRRVSAGVMPLLRLSPQETVELMLDYLGDARYPMERPPDSVDLEGWLELAWNDAPLLIVTGMNDGAVPQKPGNEAFLPESLRRGIGLRNEDDRLARDIFLTQSFIESRRHRGRVCFITGKYGQDGEPLRPSRVLLRCRDDDLPRRAQRLFGAPDDVRPSVPSSISFKLRPWVPPARDASLVLPGVLAVTAFRDYLSCPFRFYLKRVLGMEPLADTKSEMDALDFGGLVHDALARMAEDAEMRTCTSATVLRRYLHGRAEDWARKRFGPNPPLHLAMQLDVARERLSAAAQTQALEASQGWEILMWEESFQMNLGPVTVRGRIDRVDRHRETGDIRVLDYKSSEQAKSPEELHLGPPREDCRDYANTESGGKARRWTDLQLPLYLRMLRARMGDNLTMQAGYFNLPRDTDGTGVVIWQELTEPVLQSADTCALGVVMDIVDRRFWPPAIRVEYDDFEALFPVNVADCVDHTAFMKFLEEWRT